MLAGLASAVSAVFAVVVAVRWQRSRRPAFAAWSLGLLIFAGASLLQTIGEVRGFSVPVFRGFYLLGGVLGAIYLALGTVFLIVPRRAAIAAALVLAVLTAIVASAALAVPVDESRLSTPAGVLGRAIAGRGGLLQFAAMAFNIVGTMILVGGSGWSALRLWRTGMGVDRVLCNLLLTVGALVIAAGFSAAKGLGAGSMELLGGYELAGISTMFAGFLILDHSRFRSLARRALPAAAWAAQSGAARQPVGGGRGGR